MCIYLLTKPPMPVKMYAKDYATSTCVTLLICLPAKGYCYLRIKKLMYTR
jgi:hypothetical protein